MQLVSTLEGGFCNITVNGELDATSALQLDQAIRKAISSEQTYILVDCTHLTYISSAGLGVFVSYIRELAGTHRCMVLYNMSPEVRSVFDILGLDQLLHIVPSRQAAEQLCG